MKSNNKKKMPKEPSAGNGTKPRVAGSADNKAKALADKWIKKLTERGCTPDDMIAIFRMARQKLEHKLKK